MKTNNLLHDDTSADNVTDVIGPPPPKDIPLEEDLCLELARLYDEEDLTAPPHIHNF